MKPTRPKVLKRPSSKRSPKPGAVAKRSISGQPTRTLQRALSTEQQSRRSVSRGPSNMIALMRSATSTSLPGIKREASDPSLVKSVLNAEPDLMNRKSGPLSRSSSVSNLQDAKSNKKAQVEAELKEAISSLRKPNREVVGKALAEAAERRATVGSSAKSMYSSSKPCEYFWLTSTLRSEKTRQKLSRRIRCEGNTSKHTFQRCICETTCGRYTHYEH